VNLIIFHESVVDREIGAGSRKTISAVGSANCAQTRRRSSFCGRATSPCHSEVVPWSLIALPERRRELVSKQDLMARVWPNVFVEPANLLVHMSALRRAQRDGRDGHRYIRQHPRTRLLFRRLSRYVGSRDLSATGEASVAQARSAYNGSWDLLFVTQRGGCDPTYNFSVNIADGVVTHPNLVKFRGHVARSGAVRASVTVPNKYASGSGLAEARIRILKGQVVFIERLLEALNQAKGS
jgi:hypothetical protein